MKFSSTECFHFLITPGYHTIFGSPAHFDYLCQGYIPSPKMLQFTAQHMQWESVTDFRRLPRVEVWWKQIIWSTDTFSTQLSSIRILLLFAINLWCHNKCINTTYFFFKAYMINNISTVSAFLLYTFYKIFSPELLQSVGKISNKYWENFKQVMSKDQQTLSPHKKDPA